MKKDIILNKPWVLDITEEFVEKLNKFNGSVERLLDFYKLFGFEGASYDGIKRWGMDSSTETSDIKYEDIDEGMEMFMRKRTVMGFRWVIIRVTHKYNGIIFFETLGERKNKTSYIDTGANDYEWENNSGDTRYKLPKHTFYPIEVVKQSWVDISGWNAPKQMKVTIK